MANFVLSSDFRLIVTFFVQIIVVLTFLGTFVGGCNLDHKFVVGEELLHAPQRGENKSINKTSLR